MNSDVRAYSRKDLLVKKKATEYLRCHLRRGKFDSDFIHRVKLGNAMIAVAAAYGVNLQFKPPKYRAAKASRK